MTRGVSSDSTMPLGSERELRCPNDFGPPLECALNGESMHACEKYWAEAGLSCGQLDTRSRAAEDERQWSLYMWHAQL